MEITRIVALAALLSGSYFLGQAQTGSFAIVTDRECYREARAEMESYARAVERQGLRIHFIVDEWGHPDSIRCRLQALRSARQAPLEGAVFIGDIPVPMLRDAQHLTSAFKMDQERYPWHRSSVPSDRFYEDFDLEFTYLKRDTAYPLYHYYSLKAASPQRLTPDIYSGRIRPPRGPGSMERLKKYLLKAAAFKTDPPGVDQLLYFTGHGYNSQCERARSDEKIALLQQFRYLDRQEQFLEHINFTFDDAIKFRLMDELSRRDADIALLHHHGTPELQLLDGMPETTSVTDHIRDIRYYLRSKLRDAGDSPEKRRAAMDNYMASMGVPEAWFEGAFDPEQTALDSLFNANMDLSVEDHADFRPGVPFVMLDACFTGSFHRDRYIAGEYIFGEGNTLVVQANTVNALQDKWPDEMAGLLGLGIRAGTWHKMNCLLETHLIGDPTFAFALFDPETDLNGWLSAGNPSPRFWKKKLSSPHADVRALALHILYQQRGKEMSGLLLETFRSSPFWTVRMEALHLLHLCNDDAFIQAVNLGIRDSYELIQRLSAVYMGETGDPRHIPFLAEAILRNNTPKRVAYNVREAAGLFDRELLLQELEMQLLLADHVRDKEKTGEQIRKEISYGCDRIGKWVDEVLSPETTEKEKMFNIRSFRNQTVHPRLESLIAFTDTVSSPELKLAAIEMLGWFHLSHKRELIRTFCLRESEEPGINGEIRRELIKTINRIY